MKRRDITPAEGRLIQLLYVTKRMSTTAVAREVGRGQSTVHKYLASLGLSRSMREARRSHLRLQGHDERVELGVRVYVERKLSMREAARLSGAHKQTLERRLQERGLSRTSSETHLARNARGERRARVMRAGRLQQDGRTWREIAQEIGCSVGNVYYLLRDYYALVGTPGALSRPDRLSRRRARVLEMWEDGRTLRETAEALRVHTTTVIRDRQALRGIRERVVSSARPAAPAAPTRRAA